MGLFDKLKNVFMEDDIDEEPVRSVPKVEEIKKEEPVIQKRERELPVEDTFSDRELVNSKENFKFPIIFVMTSFLLSNCYIIFIYKLLHAFNSSFYC